MRRLLSVLIVAVFASAAALSKPVKKTKHLATTPLVVESCPEPVISRHSVRVEESGIGLARADVESDGKISSVRMLISTGFRDLDRSVLAAMQECTVLPALVDGKRAPGYFEKSYAFLNENDPTQREEDRARYADKYAALSAKLASNHSVSGAARPAQDSVTNASQRATAMTDTAGGQIPLQEFVPKAVMPPGGTRIMHPSIPTTSDMGCGAEIDSWGREVLSYCTKNGYTNCEQTAASQRNNEQSHPKSLAAFPPESLHDRLRTYQRPEYAKDGRTAITICVLKSLIANPEVGNKIRESLAAVDTAAIESTDSAEASNIEMRFTQARSAAQSRGVDTVMPLGGGQALPPQKSRPVHPADPANDAMTNRSGIRKQYLHDRAALANHCLQLDQENKLYGGFKNVCNKKISYGYCAYRPKKGSWVDAPFYDCEKDMATKRPNAGGLGIGPMGADTQHTNGAQRIYFFACTNDANAEELRWTGSNIEGKCIHR